MSSQESRERKRAEVVADAGRKRGFGEKSETREVAEASAKSLKFERSNEGSTLAVTCTVSHDTCTFRILLACRHSAQLRHPTRWRGAGAKQVWRSRGLDSCCRRVALLVECTAGHLQLSLSTAPLCHETNGPSPPFASSSPLPSILPAPSLCQPSTMISTSEATPQRVRHGKEDEDIACTFRQLVWDRSSR